MNNDRISWTLSAGMLLILQFQFNQVLAADFTFYTYHDKPPYYFSDKSSGTSTTPSRQGLYQTFINHLNQQQSQWRINLQYLPRKRINLLLQSDNLDGAIIGANPIWFKDKKKQLYLWSAPMLWDTDIIAVKSGRRFNYLHPDDLIGKYLGLPRGYYFWGVTENIRQGKQSALETSSELQNLKLIASNRVDATILSELTLQYYEQTLFEPGTFDALSTPHDEYLRAILFPQHTAPVFEVLDSVIESVSNSAEWRSFTHQLKFPFTATVHP